MLSEVHSAHSVLEDFNLTMHKVYSIGRQYTVYHFATVECTFKRPYFKLKISVMLKNSFVVQIHKSDSSYDMTV